MEEVKEMGGGEERERGGGEGGREGGVGLHACNISQFFG